MSYNFYLVYTKKGIKRYNNWRSCLRATKGVKGVLAYKGFNTDEEAELWIKRQKEKYTKPDLTKGFVLYCDGGSRTFDHTRRRAGSKTNPNDLSAWAYVITQNNREVHSDSGFIRGRTNNYEELNACYHGLNFLKQNGCLNSYITIITDSKYLINTLFYDWKHNKNMEKPNLRAGETLNALFLEFSDIHVSWTKGHADNKVNNKCDYLCTQEMNKY